MCVCERSSGWKVDRDKARVLAQSYLPREPLIIIEQVVHWTKGGRGGDKKKTAGSDPIQLY